MFSKKDNLIFSETSSLDYFFRPRATFWIFYFLLISFYPFFSLSAYCNLSTQKYDFSNTLGQAFASFDLKKQEKPADLLTKKDYFTFDQSDDWVFSKNEESQLKIQTICFSAISNKTYGDPSFELCATSSSSLPVSYTVISGNVTLHENKVIIRGTGSVVIRADQIGNNSYQPALPVFQSFTIAKAVLTVTPDNKLKTYGKQNPKLSYTIKGYQYNDTDNALSGSASLSTAANTKSSPGQYVIEAQQGTLSSANYGFIMKTGVLTVNKAHQKISFNQIRNKTYGEDDFDLLASSTSGLPVRFSIVSGDDVISLCESQATLIGTGVVTIAAHQEGDDSYTSASPITQSFEVKKALLTVHVDDKSRDYGTNNPQLTYTLNGFVYNEDEEVVSGAAYLSTTAEIFSDAGEYEITADDISDLYAKNYSFTSQNGSLFVHKANQSVYFDPIESQVYGVAPFRLKAKSTCGLGVSFSVLQGNATICKDQLTITGTGPITVAANQPGNDDYNPAAEVTHTFYSSAAILKVKADDKYMSYNSVTIPSLTYTITGFVNGENFSTIKGAPSLSSPATCDSEVGAYPILISPGSLRASNYTFQLEPGTLHILADCEALTHSKIVTGNLIE